MPVLRPAIRDTRASRDIQAGLMASHECPRCGLERRRNAWWDRHPAAAVCLALPAGYTIIGVLLAYPWFFVPLLVVVCTFWVDRRQRRRSAIAARADHEHRELMARAVFGPRTRSRRRRGADHWSPTQPIRQSA
jgi:hypothetical protein